MASRFGSAQDTTHLVVEDETEFFNGNRVVVTGYAGTPRPGLLTVNGAIRRRRPVWIYPLERLDGPMLVVGKQLATELLLSDGLDWSLDDTFPRVVAKSVCLESTDETSLETTKAILANSQDLGDRLIWLPGPFRPRSVRVSVDGVPYIVRRLEFEECDEPVLVRIGAETQISVAPRVTTGTDVAILVDCSGSMLVDDLPSEQNSESTTKTTLPWMPPSLPEQVGQKRMEYVHRVLAKLLQSRHQAPNTGAKTFLVGFTDQWCESFPDLEHPRCNELNEQTTKAVLDGYQRGLVELMPHQNACTRLGKGLLKVQELFEQDGRRGNKKLILMFTDGAELMEVEEKRKADESTDDPDSDFKKTVVPWSYDDESQDKKRVDDAGTDPLLVAQSLLGNVGDSDEGASGSDTETELIVIPVSSEAQYLDWCNSRGIAEDQNIRPNSELIRHLNSLTNSDFSEDEGDLAKMLSDDLRDDQPLEIGPVATKRSSLDTSDIAAIRKCRERLREQGANREFADQRSAILHSIDEHLTQCNDLSKEFWGKPIFANGYARRFLDRVATREVWSRSEYKMFIIELLGGFGRDGFERSFSPENKHREPEFDIPAIDDAFRSSEATTLLELRNAAAHPKEEFHGQSPPEVYLVEAEKVLECNGLVGMKDSDVRGWPRFQIFVLKHLDTFVDEIASALRLKAPREFKEGKRCVFFIE